MSDFIIHLNELATILPKDMNAINQFLLKKEIEINLPINDVIENLTKHHGEDFTIQKSGRNTSKFISKLSLGIGSLGDFIYSPINVNANYTLIEKNKTRVSLYTTWRVDLVFLIVMCILGVLWLGYNQLFHHSNDPLWLHLIFLSVPAWFGFIFREQEKELISKVEKFLKSF